MPERYPEGLGVMMTEALGGGPAVLLVEDETADVCLVRLALAENKVTAALHHEPDGEAALLYLEQAAAGQGGAVWPQVMMLDLNMPRMNGREMLEQLQNRPHWPSLPVIVFSTSEYDRDRQECLKLGAVDFITKPVDIDDFIAAVRRISQRWLLPPPE
jgi:CheY-like chemotaxis protein